MHIIWTLAIMLNIVKHELKPVRECIERKKKCCMYLRFTQNKYNYINIKSTKIIYVSGSYFKSIEQY